MRKREYAHKTVQDRLWKWMTRKRKHRSDPEMTLGKVIREEVLNRTVSKLEEKDFIERNLGYSIQNK